MRTEVPIGDDKLPSECPRCSGEDLCIDNVEGLTCESCGCWFDTTQDGKVIWIRNSRPVDLDFV